MKIFQIFFTRLSDYHNCFTVDVFPIQYNESGRKLISIEIFQMNFLNIQLNLMTHNNKSSSNAAVLNINPTFCIF